MKEKMIIKTKNKKNYISIVPVLFLIVQIIFITYTNLFCIPDTMDNDSAKLFIHAMEMWKNKSIFISSWINQTTLEIDCPLFLAVPLYGISNNIYISFGISNLILMILLLIVVYRLLKKLEMSFEIIMTTLVLLLIPYSFGQLLYYNMTLFGGAQYIVKILVPLLFIDSLTETKSNGTKVKKFCVNILLIILFFFSVLCAVSGREYIYLTGLFPVMCCYIWSGFLNKKSIKKSIFDKEIIICCILTALTLIGIGISHFKQVGSSTEKAVIVTIHNFTDVLIESIRSYFEILGCFPYNPLSVTSLSGVGYLLKTVFAIIVLICMISGIIEGIKKLLYADKESVIISSFAALIITNFIVLVFSGRTGEPRYLTSSIITGILLTGYEFNKILKNKQNRLSINHLFILRLSILLYICLMMSMSDITVVRGECFPPKIEDNNKLETLISYIEKYDEKTIIFLSDTDSAELLRTMDHDSGRLYFAYKTDDDGNTKKGLVVNDYYQDLTDASRLEDEHLLVVNSLFSDIEQLPGYLRKLYTPIDEYQNFTIYKAEKNRMDGISGISYNDNSRDYCYSDDYTIYEGEISDEGRLEASGKNDYVISSYYLGYYTGNIDIIMHYSGKKQDDLKAEKIGVMELWDTDSHELIESEELTPINEYGTIKMENVKLNNQNTVLKVYLDEGCVISIESFDYNKHD